MAGRLAGRPLFAFPAAVLSALLSCAGAAHAQSGANDAFIPGVGVPPGAATAAPTTSKAKAPAAKPGEGQASAGGDAGLRQRVEQLEEQLVDLQVVIGTLESLARSGGPRPASPSSGGGGFAGNDQARFDTMEMQIRALTTQIEQLAQEVRGGAPVGRRSDVGAPATDAVGFGANGPGSEPAEPPARFGSTTVTSDNLDPIGGLAAEAAGLPPVAGAAAGAQVAAIDQNVQNPKELYEMAYGYLLQQDYASAQSGFSGFLKRFPQDRLAPDALYWLGEVHYVQRNYADAAEAFDLVVSSFSKSNKAADAQLKRGMSLAQLGKKQEACSVWRDVAAKFPDAPVHVKSKAEGERQRAGCS